MASRDSKHSSILVHNSHTALRAAAYTVTTRSIYLEEYALAKEDYSNPIIVVVN